MLVRCVLWPGVRLFVTRRYCVEMAEQIELAFGTDSILDLFSYGPALFLNGIRVSPKITVYFRLERGPIL